MARRPAPLAFRPPTEEAGEMIKRAAELEGKSVNAWLLDLATARAFAVLSRHWKARESAASPKG